MDNIAVLIPCYNEVGTVAKVVRDYHAALPDATIYVYDNNSTDGTGQAAKKAGAVVRAEPIQGKGNVIRSMFRDIDANCYVMVDGDDTYPPDIVPRMVRMVMEDGYDMVIGDRLSATYFTENTRAFHNMGNKLVRKTVNDMFSGNVPDVMTGLRVFSPLFVKSFPLISGGFELETEMTIFALSRNMRIASLPVEYRDRPEGSVSKLHTYSDGARVLCSIGRMLRSYRPFIYFTIISLFLALIGLIFFLPVLTEYFATGLVPRFPTMIVAITFWIVAAITFSNGMILENMARHERLRFEEEKNILLMLIHVYQGK